MNVHHGSKQSSRRSSLSFRGQRKDIVTFSNLEGTSDAFKRIGARRFVRESRVSDAVFCIVLTVHRIALHAPGGELLELPAAPGS